ncbi:hypothetical protein F5X99DRAFT_427565 [Biscogniauxia marginata]|nr:hypothetical protein F5X99DRAFT_427565 [Biscogniauxia marginata]
MSHTCSNLPISSTYQKYSHRTSPTNIPASKASIATSYATATALPRPLAENIPPSSSTASIGTYRENSIDTDEASLLPQSIPKAKNKFRGGIPKSRTLNVFSNLTSSFSRTSLGTFTHGDSRHPSASSERTNLDTTSATPRPDSSGSSFASGPLRTPICITPNANNSRQIHRAQPSEYWAGRFMALQDRFRSELLMPDNMNTLVSAHAERSMIGASQPPFGGGSLATSATTSCLSTSAITPRSVRSVTTNTTSTANPTSVSPRKQQHQPQRVKQQANPATPLLGQQKHKHTNSNSTIFSNAASSNRSSSEAAALLTDEDNRSRRVFLHLEALCTTDEASRSLRAWQQGYARRMGKANLLPRGGTMEDRNRDSTNHHGQWRDRTWVGRLLSGSSSSSGGGGGGGPGVKRGSFGF